MHREALKPGSVKLFLIILLSVYANISLLPSFISHTCAQDKLAIGKSIKTKLVTLCWQGDEEKDPSAEVVRLPVPYQLPPQLYGPEG
jgi:hypothetical protein